MSEKLLVKRPIYPLFSVLSSVLILVIGLITAKGASCVWYLCATWLLFLLFGYWRSCFAIIPAAAMLSAILAGITYAISRDIQSAYAAVNRILTVCIAVIPGLALSPIYLVRNFSTLKIPRIVTLGMMITLNFFPLLGGEIRQVREAMKTRGTGSFFSPHIFYRAFLIPLLIRLVNISDTLALSVETRGFTMEGTGYSIYKTVHLRLWDLAFLLILLAISILAVIF